MVAVMKDLQVRKSSGFHNLFIHFIPGIRTSSNHTLSGCIGLLGLFLLPNFVPHSTFSSPATFYVIFISFIISVRSDGQCPGYLQASMDSSLSETCFAGQRGTGGPIL